jgi:hypothetical protein
MNTSIIETCGTRQKIFDIILQSEGGIDEPKIREILSKNYELSDRSNIRTHLEALHKARVIEKSPFRRGYPNKWMIRIDQDSPNNSPIIFYLIQYIEQLEWLVFCITETPGYRAIVSLPDIDRLIIHMLGNELENTHNVFPIAEDDFSGSNVFYPTQIVNAGVYKEYREYQSSHLLSPSEITDELVNLYKKCLFISLTLLKNLLITSIEICTLSRIVTDNNEIKPYSLLIGSLACDVYDYDPHGQKKVGEFIQTCPKIVQERWNEIYPRVRNPLLIN